MDTISVRDILIMKQTIFAAWDLLPPEHHRSVLACLACDPLAGDRVIAAKLLNEIMEDVNGAEDAPAQERSAIPRESGPVRALLVDGCPLFRMALHAALAHADGWFELAQAGTAARALELASAIRPEVVVVDVDLPDMSGFELCRRFAKEHPGTRVLLTSVHDWDIHLVQAVLVGASGFVWKNAGPEDLVQAVRRAGGRPSRSRRSGG